MHFSKKSLTLLSVLFIFCLDAFGPGLIHSICASLVSTKQNIFILQDASLFKTGFILVTLYILFPIAQFIAAPLAGDFSDIFGHKKTLIFTLIGSICGYLLISLSIFLSSVWLLYASCFFTGLFASNGAIGYAAVAGLDKEEAARAKNFSLIISIGSIGSVAAITVGPLFFIPLKDPFLSFVFPFLIAAGLFAGNLLFMLFAFEKDIPSSGKASFNLANETHNIIGALRDPKFKNSCFVFFFLVSSWTICFQYYPINLIDSFHTTPFQVMINLMMVSIAWFCSNFFFQKRFASVAHPQQMLSITLFIFSLFIFSCFIQKTYFLFSLYFTLMSIFAALSWSNSLTYVSLSASSENQGRAFGIIQSFSSLAAIITTLLKNATASFYPKSVFLLGISYAILALIYLHKNNKAYPTKPV
ncbi:MAG: MFS transporter [Chlamydiota bacterium]